MSRERNYPNTVNFLLAAQRLRRERILAAKEEKKKAAVGKCTGKCCWIAQMFCSVCKTCGQDDY